MQSVPKMMPSVVTMIDGPSFGNGAPLKDMLMLKDMEVPMELKGHEVLIEIRAISLGTGDVNALKIMKKSTMPGMDFAGVVVKCNTGMWKEGDRVCGSLLGGLSCTIDDKMVLERYGCFGSCAMYCRTICEMVMKMPDLMSFEDGCSFPSSMMMAFQAFCCMKQMPLEMSKTHEPILVMGGGTSLGLCCLQMGHMLGYNMLCVCDMMDMKMCEKYGADMCFEFNSAKLVVDIMKATHNKLSMCIDCSSKESSLGIAAKCMGSVGGLCCMFPSIMMGGRLMMDEMTEIGEKMKVVQMLPTTLFGWDAKMTGTMFKPKPSESKSYMAFLKSCSTWMAEGKLMTLPIEMGTLMGMDGVVDGMEKIRMSGETMKGVRMCFKMEDTMM